MNKLSECGCRRLRPPPRQAGQAGQHGVGLLKANIGDLAAVTGVPTKRGSAESPGIVDQEQDELERVREANEVEFGGRCQRNGVFP
jgi:hypothetical protein